MTMEGAQVRHRWSHRTNVALPLSWTLADVQHQQRFSLQRLKTWQEVTESEEAFVWAHSLRAQSIMA